MERRGRGRRRKQRKENVIGDPECVHQRIYELGVNAATCQVRVVGGLDEVVGQGLGHVLPPGQPVQHHHRRLWTHQEIQEAFGRNETWKERQAEALAPPPRPARPTRLPTAASLTSVGVGGAGLVFVDQGLDLVLPQAREELLVESGVPLLLVEEFGEILLRHGGFGGAGGHADKRANLFSSARDPTSPSPRHLPT